LKRKRLTLNDTEQLSRQFGFDKADQDCLQKDYHMHALRDVYFGKVVFQTMDDASYSLIFDLGKKNGIHPQQLQGLAAKCCKMRKI
jgi:hypothetical protein